MDLSQIQDHPLFRQLASERSRFGASMSIGMAAAYFTYILTIAFWPQLLGLPLWLSLVVPLIPSVLATRWLLKEPRVAA